MLQYRDDAISALIEAKKIYGNKSSEHFLKYTYIAQYNTEVAFSEEI